MIHPNWIPIEKFDRESNFYEAHLFLSYYKCPEYGTEYFDCDSGYWDGSKFYNGDVYFEPTHYLDPAVYKCEAE